MAQAYKERVKVKDLEAELEPLFALWQANRKEGEGFGYFCQRVGVDTCRDYAEGYVRPDAAKNEVAVMDELYAKLAKKASAEGKSVAHVANELLRRAVA
jgi:sulfite reductase (ferredoxin)